MTEITEEVFFVATGHLPENDDLERCNCPQAGEIAHGCCGWDEENNQPQFYTGPKYNDPKYNSG